MSLQQKLQVLNPTVEVERNDSKYVIKKLWNDDSFILEFPDKFNFEIFNDKYFPPEFSAILHEKSSYEFIFTILPHNHKLIGRELSFIYDGNEYKTKFAEPSNLLVEISKGFKEIDAPGDASYRNLSIIRDFYNIESQSTALKDFFKDKVVVSFFVEGALNKVKDCNHFFKLLNIYMQYYDRDSPTIIIHNTLSEEVEHNKPCLLRKNPFPEKLIINDIDETVVELFHVAKSSSNIRLQYLFYYQVIEYFSYYFINDNTKRNINNIISYPNFIDNSSYYSKLLIEELREGINKDSEKFKACIKHFLRIEDIDDEIESNIEYFTEDIIFDGGYKLKPILKSRQFYEQLFLNANDNKSEKIRKERETGELFENIADRLDKIRNVLVHVREMRERSAISPTQSNHNKLLPYYYLIRRISEIIAMKYKSIF
ncbi:hypothetical protein GCM10007424_01460 [Flavobacterium suaedae]|uniref:ApeA N-terminal domain-containing protein n=1 Tax=Flavobacterium suaedae TaxID=1767027 RepID=A0ABQ1JFQ5_9FLAO|nr:hypothetical protein [Flavobacterium suaedae]GGB65240.1 hypothetical protein GCM10007424_01460 [Flavobacterium suaedae]